MLGIDGKSTQESTNFDSCATKLEKISFKHSIEKPMLLNFVDLSTIFCLRLLRYLM